MTKKYIYYYTALLLIFLTGCSERPSLSDPSENIPEMKEVIITKAGGETQLFSFPSPEEVMHLSIQEQIAAYQIPETLLAEIPTEELAEICLVHPLLSEALFSSNPAYTISVVMEGFNGFAELLGRENYPEAIVNAIDFKVSSYIEQLETSEEDIYEFYANLFLWSKFIAIETLQSQIEDAVPDIDERISKWFSISDLNARIEMQSELAAGDEIQSTTYYDGQHYPLKTPFGTEISSAIYRVESYPQNSTWLNNFKNSIKTSHPTAEVIAGPSRQYNCHFYAWNGLSQGLKIWVNDPHDYWLDGSYDETTATDPEAKIVFYYNGYNVNSYHSGIIQTDGKIISKWGEGGIVRHDLTDVPPEYGTSLRYFKPHKIEIEEGNTTVTIPDEGYTVSKTFHISGMPEGSSVNWEVQGDASITSGQNTDSLQVELGGDAKIYAHITVPPGGIITKSSAITARYLMPRLTNVTFIPAYDGFPEENVLTLLAYHNSEIECSWSVTSANGNSTNRVQMWDIDFSGDALLASYPFNEMRMLDFTEYGSYLLHLTGLNSYGKSTLTISMTYSASGYVFGDPVRTTVSYSPLIPPPFPPM